MISTPTLTPGASSGVGLLTQSTATGFTFKSRNLVPMGALVAAEVTPTYKVFGIVTNLTTELSALGREIADAMTNNGNGSFPGVTQQASTLISVTIVGYEKDGKLFKIMPPTPPTSLNRIIQVEGAEFKMFTPDGSYLLPLIHTRGEVPVANLLSAALYQAMQIWNDPQWMGGVLRLLTSQLKSDYATLNSLTMAVDSLIPDDYVPQDAHASGDLGIVVGGNMGELNIRVTAPLSEVQEGAFVVVESGKMRIYAMLAQIELGSTTTEFADSGYHMSQKVRNLLAGQALYAKASLLPVLMQENGVSSRVVAVKTVPEHFSQVRLASAEDIKLIYGEPGEPQNFVIGTTRQQSHSVCLDLDRFVQRSSGIFGATGSGKSFLARMVLAGLIHRNQASVLIFDMHNEYGYDDVASDSGRRVVGLKSKFNKDVKIVGVGKGAMIRGNVPDLTLEIPNTIIGTNDIALLKAQLDLNESSGIVLEALKNDFGAKWFLQFSRMVVGAKTTNSIGKKVKTDWAPNSVERWAMTAGVNMFSAVALWNKLSAVRNKKYIVTNPAVDGIEEIVRMLQGGQHVVLSFGKNNSDLDYLLITNVLLRQISRIWEERADANRNGTSKEPRPLVIVLEEAHKLLSPNLASQTSFGLIAREMRKFYVTLLVIDQRPSQIDENVLSQLGTRVTGWLGDPDDIHAVLVGQPGQEALRGMLQRLQPKEEALILGWGVPIPTTVKTTVYNDAFWQVLFAKVRGVPTNIFEVPRKMFGEIGDEFVAEKPKTKRKASANLSVSANSTQPVSALKGEDFGETFHEEGLGEAFVEDGLGEGFAEDNLDEAFVEDENEGEYEEEGDEEKDTEEDVDDLINTMLGNI